MEFKIKTAEKGIWFHRLFKDFVNWGKLIPLYVDNNSGLMSFKTQSSTEPQNTLTKSISVYQEENYGQDTYTIEN